MKKNEPGEIVNHSNEKEKNGKNEETKMNEIMEKSRINPNEDEENVKEITRYKRERKIAFQ